MIAWLLVLFVAAAHASEPLTVTIEGKDQYTPWDQLYIGQSTLEVQFRVDSDRTIEVEVSCTFRVPEKGMKITNIAHGVVVAAQPSHGRFTQWVPTGSVGYDLDDWEVGCEVRSR